MPSIRKTIIFAFAAALAVVSLVYFPHRPKPPAPRQTVKTLHELGIFPKDYDGWLAHVEAELLAEGEERPEDPLYPPGLLRTPIIVDLNASGRIFLNNTEFSLPGLISILKRTFEGQSEPDPLTFRAADDVRIEAVETVVREIVAAGFGGNTRPHLEGKKFNRVYSLKLGGRFMRVTVYDDEKWPKRKREVVTSLHQIGILPKGYDGWLAHVEAELLAIGETRPANPLLPVDDARLRSATIVSVTAKGDVSLNSKAMTSAALVAILKRASEGQTDLAPLLFEIPLEAPLSAVEPIARAINDGGFGAHQLLKIVGGEVLLENSRVYSIKLGGRFIRL